jgi:pseudouridine kinase
MSLALTGPMLTGCYLAILDAHGEMMSAINDMRAIEWLKIAHLDGFAEKLASADMLVADCNIDVRCLDWLCRFSADRNVRLLIEPVSVPKAKKLTQFKRQHPVFAVTPNRQQIEAMTGERDMPTAIAALHRMGFANVVVHRGAQGAVASDGAQQAEIPAAPVGAVADVTGAGDAAVAGLVFGLVEGMTLVAAARLGQRAAALKLGSHLSVAPQLTRDRLLAS